MALKTFQLVKKASKKNEMETVLNVKRQQFN